METHYTKPEVVDYGDLLELTTAARFAQVAIPLGSTGDSTNSQSEPGTGATTGTS